jgi:hypothetical protein
MLSISYFDTILSFRQHGVYCNTKEKTTKQIVHRIGAITITLCITIFSTATIAVEVFSAAQAIATGTPAFASSNGSSKGLIGNKKRCIPLFGANGLLMLLPLAITNQAIDINTLSRRVFAHGMA